MYCISTVRMYCIQRDDQWLLHGLLEKALATYSVQLGYTVQY